MGKNVFTVHRLYFSPLTLYKICYLFLLLEIKKKLLQLRKVPDTLIQVLYIPNIFFRNKLYLYFAMTSFRDFE